jgi:hypothetical protein
MTLADDILDDQSRASSAICAWCRACVEPGGLKYAVEAGRHSSHTAARPASQVQPGQRGGGMRLQPDRLSGQPPGARGREPVVPAQPPVHDLFPVHPARHRPLARQQPLESCSI